jgi:hypothetical protein
VGVRPCDEFGETGGFGDGGGFGHGGFSMCVAFSSI